MSAYEDRGSGRRPDDELMRHYHEANAQDMGRPGAHVRLRVQAHARAVLQAQKQAATIAQIPVEREAANQPRWKLSMLASIALAGLTGLLVLQFDRGTPEEKEMAMGQARAPAAAPPNPAPAAVREAAPLTKPPAAAARPETDTRKPAAALKVPAPPIQSQPARRDLAETRSESKAVPSQGSLTAEEVSAPSSFPASPPAAAMLAPPAMADRAMRAPMASPAPAAASAAAAAPRARAEASGFADSAAPLLEAARTGRSADIVQLLRRGAPINTTDGLGRTPLMLAVINGQELAVQQLLALGANRALADQQGLTALDHARRLGLNSIAAMIEAAH